MAFLTFRSRSSYKPELKHCETLSIFTKVVRGRDLEIICINPRKLFIKKIFPYVLTIVIDTVEWDTCFWTAGLPLTFDYNKAEHVIKLLQVSKGN